MMILWISSYPKSGNTWIRALISTYLYSDDGNFEFKLLHKELKDYNKELLEKKIIIAITKSDLVIEEELNNLKINLDEEIIKI